MYYIKNILNIKIIKILPDVNGVTAIRYAIGEMKNGEKVFLKVCIRRRHRNTNAELVQKFTKIANYKNKKINHIYAIKQGIFLNFMINSYINDFIELEDLLKSKEYKDPKSRKKITKKLHSELEKMISDLREAKVVHNDVHDGNIILLKNGKNVDDFYLALTDFSLAKEYNSLKEWEKEFKKSDEKELRKIFDEIS
jgi:tRNA A-37 threonylcarbamoyl transferase component Bud32